MEDAVERAVGDERRASIDWSACGRARDLRGRGSGRDRRGARARAGIWNWRMPAAVVDERGRGRGVAPRRRSGGPSCPGSARRRRGGARRGRGRSSFARRAALAGHQAAVFGVEEEDEPQEDGEEAAVDVVRDRAARTSRRSSPLARSSAAWKPRSSS